MDICFSFNRKNDHGLRKREDVKRWWLCITWELVRCLHTPIWESSKICNWGMESNKNVVNSFLHLFIVGNPIRRHSFKKLFFTDNRKKWNNRKNKKLVGCDKNMICFMNRKTKVDTMILDSIFIKNGNMRSRGGATSLVPNIIGKYHLCFCPIFQ